MVQIRWVLIGVVMGSALGIVLWLYQFQNLEQKSDQQPKQLAAKETVKPAEDTLPPSDARTIVSNEALWQSNNGWGANLACGPNCQVVARGVGLLEIEAWDLQNRKKLLDYALAKEYKGITERTTHTYVVMGMAFSPDCRRLAAAYGEFIFSSAGYNPGSSGGVKVWDLASPKEPLIFKGHTKNVHEVAFSPDGSRVASVAEDHTLKIWSSTTGEEQLSFHWDAYLDGFQSRISMAFSPDGELLAVGTDEYRPGGLLVLHAADGEQFLTQPNMAVTALAFSADGNRLAIGTGKRPAIGSKRQPKSTEPWKVLVYDLKTRKEEKAFELKAGQRPGGVGFSNDGRYLAVGLETGGVILDMASGKEMFNLVRTLSYSPESVRNFVFTADNQRVYGIPGPWVWNLGNPP